MKNYIFTLNISSENGKLLTNLIEIASHYAFKSEFSIGADILMGYSLNPPFYLKIQVIAPKKTGEKIQKLRDILIYLSKIYTISPYTAEPMIYLKKEKRIKEAWKPNYLVWVHENLKKMKLLFPEDIGNRKECMSVKVPKGDEKICALTLTALSTGLHRHAMAVKQVAAQEVATKIILENRKKLYPLIAALVIDNYLWMPKVLRKIYISKTSEIHYSMAATSIREIEKFIEEFDFKETLMKMLENSNNFFLETFRKNCFKKIDSLSEFKETLQKIIETISKTVISTFSPLIEKSDFKKEVLLGRLFTILERLEKIETAKNILLTVTEQTAPCLLKILKKYLNMKRATIIYTPQTLFNRLLIQTQLSSNYNVEYIPVPPTEPNNVQIILKDLLADKKFDLAILQGAMTIVLPTLLTIQEKTPKERIIIL